MKHWDLGSFGIGPYETSGQFSYLWKKETELRNVGIVNYRTRIPFPRGYKLNYYLGSYSRDDPIFSRPSRTFYIPVSDFGSKIFAILVGLDGQVALELLVNRVSLNNNESCRT